MATRPAISPGTVSKILWHFTGGPVWDRAKKRQNTTPKDAAEAHEHLKSILESKILRLGNYREIVKGRLATRRIRDKVTRKWVVKRNVPVALYSAAVCCLSDIPAPHLRYHAHRYGKFALGFHRESAIRAGFNPVLYTLENSALMQSIYGTFAPLEDIDFEEIENAIEEIGTEASAQASLEEADIDIEHEVFDAEAKLRKAQKTVEECNKHMDVALAFIKSFNKREFASIYCEREWRSIRSFGFSYDDVAMIVVPKMVGRTTYYRPFVERWISTAKIPKRIPVVPWEDLIEH